MWRITPHGKQGRNAASISGCCLPGTERWPGILFVHFSSLSEPDTPSVVIGVYIIGEAGFVHHGKSLVDPFKNTAVKVGNMGKASLLKFFRHLLAAVAHGAIHQYASVFGKINR